MDATPEEHTSYGQQYAIYATLVGPSGTSADVVSVWVVRDNRYGPEAGMAATGDQRIACLEDPCPTRKFTQLDY
jgi:hypothetical protein